MYYLNIKMDGDVPLTVFTSDDISEVQNIKVELLLKVKEALMQKRPLVLDMDRNWCSVIPYETLCNQSSIDISIIELDKISF